MIETVELERLRAIEAAAGAYIRHWMQYSQGLEWETDRNILAFRLSQAMLFGREAA